MSSKTRDPNRLPQGAEAALWSIVESLPDPRNHLALTRDETAQVRLSPRDVAAAQEVGHGDAVDDHLDLSEPRPRHDGVRWSADTAEVRPPMLSTQWAGGA